MRRNDEDTKRVLKIIKIISAIISVIVPVAVVFALAGEYIIRGLEYFWPVVVGVVAVIILLTVIFVCIAIHEQKKWKELVEGIKKEFDLDENGIYDVVQNGGNVLRNLQFVKIYNGNRSSNGRLNILFIRHSKYRGDIIEKEVVVKYESIWKVYRVL